MLHLDGHRYEVVLWDHREQPPWDQIKEALKQGLHFISEVDTGSDSYAIVLSWRDHSGWDENFAQKMFDQWYNDPNTWGSDDIRDST